MEVVRKGYWLGQSVCKVDKGTVRDLERFFGILDYGHDVSVLSEAEIQFCFFYYEPSFHTLFLTAAKLCKNLNKKLVILYKNSVGPEVLDDPSILDSIDMHSPLFSSWCESLNQQIIFQLKQHQDVLDIDSLSEQKHISKDLVEILKYIDKNLSRTIREEDVAEYCHYSVTYFSKFFHKTVGISFRDYLTTKRIELAKQLLSLNKKEKISFIAFQCGYNDVSYFSRIFKKKTGISPANYRLLH